MELITLEFEGGPHDGRTITVDPDQIKAPAQVNFLVDSGLVADPRLWPDRLPPGALVARYVRPTTPQEVDHALACYLAGEPIKYRFVGEFRWADNEDQRSAD